MEFAPFCRPFRYLVGQHAFAAGDLTVVYFVGTAGAYVEHDEHADDRRSDDGERGRLDNEKLFAKWDLPPKNERRNDFDPARPCTLRGLRQAA